MCRTKMSSGLCAAALLLSVLVLLQAGCGGNGGSATATGTLQAAITDAASATFSGVHITIDKVVVVPAGKESLADNDPALPVVATFPGGTGVDILNLHFLPQILGSVNLPAGSYSQVRLILAPNQPTLNNYVTLSGSSTKLALTTPSAQETGVKIVGNFTVTAGALNTILLDFDPNTAIVFAGNSGNIQLKPTGIRLVQVYNSLSNAGAVNGVIRSPSFQSWSSATVTVIPRNPAGGAVVSGAVFSNLSSSSRWEAPFAAFLPPNGSSAMPSANYKVFVQAFSHTTTTGPVFRLYSSPTFSITSGVDTPVPPNGEVMLAP